MKRLWLLFLLLAACAKPPEPPRPELSAPEPYRPALSYNGGSAAQRVGGGQGQPLVGELRRSTDEEFARSLSREALDATERPRTIVAASAPAAPRAERRTVAVIINGDDDHHGTGPKHAVNVELGRAFIRSRYGAADSDILVLTPRGKAATRANVLALAREAAGRVRAGDRLVIYTTGHGLKQNGRWMLWLQGGQRIYLDEFAQAFLDNAAAEVVYIGDQCYSGEFARQVAYSARAKGKAVISMASTDSDHQAICEYFIRPFFAAFADAANDVDRDGTVDEYEAYIAARRRHKASLAATPELANSQYLAFAAPVPSS